MGIVETKMQTITMGYIGCRIRGIWGSYYIIPKAIFYLLKGDYTSKMLGPCRFSGAHPIIVWSFAWGCVTGKGCRFYSFFA